jgi:hypothetical protein
MLSESSKISSIDVYANINPFLFRLPMIAEEEEGEEEEGEEGEEEEVVVVVVVVVVP